MPCPDSHASHDDSQIALMTEFSVLPRLVVLDLDACLWSPEMYILNRPPTSEIRGPLGGMGEGVAGVTNGEETVTLIPSALRVLQEIAKGSYGPSPTLLLAAASSADTPLATECAFAAMSRLEVLPGLTLRNLFDQSWYVLANMSLSEAKTYGISEATHASAPEVLRTAAHLQVGRQPPLSYHKGQTHFPIIQRATAVPYCEMIFLDDCGWSDNCAQVERCCPGVISQKTPIGVDAISWNRVLEKYSAANS